MRVEMLVKKVRKEKNISIAELSLKSNISISHIYDIEKNMKIPSLYIAIRLAKALNVSITELYNVKW